MFSSWITVLFCLHYIDPLLTVTCVYYEKGEYFVKLNKTTCEGDFCYNYGKPKNVFGGREIDQGCASGFDFPMGCVGDPLQGVLCLCNTSNCNSDVLKGTEGFVPPNSTCYGYAEIYSNEVFTEAQKRNTTMQGAVCSVKAIEFFFNGPETIEPLQTYTSAVSNTNSTHLFHLPVGSFRRQLDLTLANFFTLFYHYGGLYHTPASNYNEYYYKCKGDYCNAINTTWVPRGKVNCTGTMYGGYPPPCYGTVCIYGEKNMTEEFEYNDWRDCWNVNETNASGQFTPGIYKFKNMTWYLCNEDHCNVDEQSARKSIENYRLAMKPNKDGVSLNIPNKDGVMDSQITEEKTNHTMFDSPNSSPIEKGSENRRMEIFLVVISVVYWCF